MRSRMYELGWYWSGRYRQDSVYIHVRGWKDKSYLLVSKRTSGNQARRHCSGGGCGLSPVHVSKYVRQSARDMEMYA